MSSKNPKASVTSPRSGKWLQNARFKRLNTIIQTKTEDIKVVKNNHLILDTTIQSNDLDKSGLSIYEIEIIENWHNNCLSGHQALVAIYNHRYHNIIASTPPSSSISALKNVKPLDLLSLSISFPSNCFQLTNKSIYIDLFAKNPKVIVKETFDLIKEKSCEKSLKALTIEQMNLAIKQIRLDNMKMSPKLSINNEKENSPQTSFHEESHTSTISLTSTTTTAAASIGTIPSVTLSSTSTTEDRLSKEDEDLKVQVLIELLRLHIASFTSNHSDVSVEATQKTSPIKVSSPWEWDAANIDKHLKEASIKKKPSNDNNNGNNSNNTAVNMDTSILGSHLMTPLPTIQEKSLSLSIEDLESSNTVFKPYLRHLANLKSMLSVQIQDLEETKAYLALGVNQDSNESTLKKAYRNMAIKLHPDKPGGDTAKFQKLQDFYQEIMKKRNENTLIHERLEQYKLNPKHIEMISKSHELLEKIWKYTQEIQEYASKTSLGTQKHIKFIKKLKEKCYPSTTMIKSKGKHLIEEPMSELELKELCHSHRAKHHIVSNIITYCEKVCEQTQQLATLSMTLPTIHSRYGLLIAKMNNNASNTNSYLKDIEICMSLSLEVLRSITDLMSVDHRVCHVLSSSAVTQLPSMYGMRQQVVQDYHKRLIEVYEEQQEIIRKTANHMMNCALTCGQIYSFMESIISNIDSMILDEIKKDVKVETEYQGYSDEDKEILRRQAEAAAAASKPSSSTNGTSSTSTSTTGHSGIESTVVVSYSQSTAADKHETSDGNDTDRHTDNDNDNNTENKDETENKNLSNDSMDDQKNNVASELNELRSRIHSLQVKLHVQNIQIFQTLNTEVRDLQIKLQSEVLGVLTIELSSTSQATLLSLLAECIDGNLTNLRSDIENRMILLSSEQNLFPSTKSSTNTKVTQYEPQIIVDLLQQHLGWMLELKGSNRLTLDSLFPVHPQTTSSTNMENGIDRIDMTNRIALLPDYRSKTLWLSSLLDVQSVTDLINDEMYSRLVDTIDPIASNLNETELFTDTDQIVDRKEQIGKQFCKMILVGVKLASISTEYKSSQQKK